LISLFKTVKPVPRQKMYMANVRVNYTILAYICPVCLQKSKTKSGKIRIQISVATKYSLAGTNPFIATY